MRINKIALSKLLKLEVPQLAKLVLVIVEKHEPENLFLEKAFNDFSTLEPEIESLIVGHGPHPLTPQIEEFRQKRLLYATSISFQARGLARGYIDGTDDAVKKVNHAVKLYLHNLKENNEEIINEKIDQFLSEIESNEELEVALSALGLTKYFNDLRSAHSSLKILLFKRNASIAKRPKGVSRMALKAVRNGIRMLFTRIEVAQIDNKDLDYTQLISELNEKLIRYNGLIKTRETALKNKKEGLDENGATAPASRSYNLNAGNVVYGNFDFPTEDQKKTAATPSKTLQLPDVKKDEV